MARSTSFADGAIRFNVTHSVFWRGNINLLNLVGLALKCSKTYFVKIFANLTQRLRQTKSCCILLQIPFCKAQIPSAAPWSIPLPFSRNLPLSDLAFCYRANPTRWSRASFPVEQGPLMFDQPALRLHKRFPLKSWRCLAAFIGSKLNAVFTFLFRFRQIH